MLIITGTTCRVKMRCKMTLPQKTATKPFIVLIASAIHGEIQKNILTKSDPGKVVNWHIFKMAAIQNFNLQTVV